MARYLVCTLGVLAALSLGACGSSDESTTSEVPEGSLNVSCSGKCDGWGSIKSLWGDAKKLDLGDLISKGAGFATDGLNNALDVSEYAGIQLSAPKLYSTQDKAAGDLTLGNLDALTTGLASAFGERELTTDRSVSGPITQPMSVIHK